jgi:solute carrier family 13 (sodium-dependent dicarboxylate transporter), member 2/3/5
LAAIDSSIAEPREAAPAAPGRSVSLRLAQTLFCLGAGAAIWFSPWAIANNTKAALAISAMMIIAWMTEVMEYASAGLVGLFLFWIFGIAKPEIIFSGFVNDASWFYIGAVFLGAMATKTGLPQRIAGFVVNRVGLTYSRLLLGLIVIGFLLTFIVPSGVARVVIMAPICIGVIELFGVEKGSNIGKGIFLLMTYTCAIFDKMIIAGTGAITARNIIERIGMVEVTYSFWLLAFFPCSIATILVGWRLALWLFPPEIASLEGRRAEVQAHFNKVSAWTPMHTKACILVLLALGLWLTDWLHGISAAKVAFGVGLIGLLPFVDVLDAEDFRKANLLPYFFVAAALGMSEVLRSTGGLKLLTDTFLGGMEPLIANRLIAVPVLYWTAFVYHFFTASEISMLATSLPILMEFAKSHGLDALWVGMVWTFAAGGKLFAYQSAPLIVGYAYGYFKHTDMLKLGAILTVVEFIMLTFCTGIFWPLMGF